MELDTYFGDILAVITDLEGSIVRELQAGVVKYEGLLQVGKGWEGSETR